MKEIKLPDGEKIKQVAVGRGCDGKPFFVFLSEGGRVYAEDNQGWPPLERLNEVVQAEPKQTVIRKCPANCEFLSITETEQGLQKKRPQDIHFCNKYKARIYHSGIHPNLIMHDDCEVYNEKIQR